MIALNQCENLMAPGMLIHLNELVARKVGMVMENGIADCRQFHEILLHKNSMEVIGVVLVNERFVGKNVLTTDGQNVVLGTVCIAKGIWMHLDELRKLLCNELPGVPVSFDFLTRHGWPVQKAQEYRIKSSYITRENNFICILRSFEKSRIGIMNSSGDPMGFIFTDLNISIRQLRETIEQQLKLNNQLQAEYRFVEQNGWPVMSHQETSLCLMDVMFGHIVRIQTSCSGVMEYIRPTSLVYKFPLSIENQLPSLQENNIHEPVQRKKSLKFRNSQRLSMKGKKGSVRRPRVLKISSAPPILISYVRAEAAQYALDLKQELVSLGLNVYLDVHEIKTGSDWQDALNDAVTDCFLFAPLITPMYGKTQWTNREVKLADVLGKTIIPVNFTESWPPPCLAIQFASTQYIPWKLPKTDHVKGESEKSCDNRNWDPVCMKRVSRKIAECYIDCYSKLKRSPSRKEATQPPMRNPLFSLREDYYSIPKDEYGDEIRQNIVISAHPHQWNLANELKTMLEKNGYEVWCSLDLLDQRLLLSNEITSNPATLRNLPINQKRDVIFSHNDLETFTVLKDKVPDIYQEEESYGKRPLSRLMSQFSNIDQPLSLSHDKLDQLRTFQQKVDQAAVVVVLVSEAYTQSTFSHQQVFYCEHRKRVVLVRCDVSLIPKWFRLLMGNDMIMVSNPQLECILNARLKRAINPSSSETPKDATGEAKMNYLVNFLKKNLPFKDLCVYVAGSSKLQSQRAIEICRAIGRELAKIERVSLVTGGFFGAADITAKTFSECRANNISFNTEDESVVHILPMRDSEDLTAKAKQNLADGSFEAIPYGKTVFLGDSAKEREAVVARLLDTCIIIEGGLGVVQEVEEFIWNDHFVIPIMSTGGAAGGMYGVPVKIFQLPPGVDKADWSVLSEKNATPEDVAKAVVNITVSLKTSLSSPTSTPQKSTTILKRKSHRKLKSRKLKPDKDMKQMGLSPASIPIYNSSMESVLNKSKIVQCTSNNHRSIIAKEKSHSWGKLLNYLKRKI